MSTYRSGLKLGTLYRDKQTGFEGHCTVVSFFEHGCERATLKGMDSQGRIVEFAFDAPELEEAKTDKAVELVERKTGGPHDRAPMRRR